MIKRIFILLTFAVLLLAACGSQETGQPASKQAAGPTVTVYHSPT